MLHCQIRPGTFSKGKHAVSPKFQCYRFISSWLGGVIEAGADHRRLSYRQSKESERDHDVDRQSVEARKDKSSRREIMKAAVAIVRVRLAQEHLEHVLSADLGSVHCL